jgi:hypothetical protein
LVSTGNIGNRAGKTPDSWKIIAIVLSNWARNQSTSLDMTISYEVLLFAETDFIDAQHRSPFTLALGHGIHGSSTVPAGCSLPTAGCVRSVICLENYCNKGSTGLRSAGRGVGV